ncbi:hypothetical protein BHE74_00034068 [Ensete ventricosum]|nr:hypothetical protein BHE74_00034068 [Ensete ventricosum]
MQRLGESPRGVSTCRAIGSSDRWLARSVSGGDQDLRKGLRRGVGAVGIALHRVMLSSVSRVSIGEAVGRKYNVLSNRRGPRPSVSRLSGCQGGHPRSPQGDVSKLTGRDDVVLGLACVVNGALEYLARDLGIAKNTVLQGWVVSTTLAGATVGSFTGGALADKLGRTRTFQLDAIPLVIGAFLRWRTMFAVAIFPAVLMALGMAVCPESPRWLFQQGKLSQAETAMKKLYGKEKVAEVMHGLRAGGEGSTEPDAGWFDLFSKRYRKVVSVGAALFLFQQFAGINAVVYYSTAVFRSAGISSDVAASALVGASNVFGMFFRVQAASMSLLSLCFASKSLAPYSGTLAVLGTVLYVLSFSLGAGPVPALLLPEIFASRIRAKAVALSLGMHWVSNFVIGLCFLSVVNRFGIGRVYLGFATVCVLAALYIAGNVVETKGRSLEEIERALSSTAD